MLIEYFKPQVVNCKFTINQMINYHSQSCSKITHFKCLLTLKDATGGNGLCKSRDNIQEELDLREQYILTYYRNRGILHHYRKKKECDNKLKDVEIRKAQAFCKNICFKSGVI